MSLFDNVNECAMLDADLDSDAFNECLRQIQEDLGQDDGGNASIFFSGVEGWETLGYEERHRVLTLYVADELSSTCDAEKMGLV